MDQELESLLGKWHGLCPRRSVHPILRPPELPAYQGHPIRERGLSLVVPGREGYRDRTLVAHPSRPQGNERAQGQQDRGDARTRLVRPWALRCQPALGAPLLTGHVARPAPDDPCQERLRGRLPVGTAERVHAPLPLGVSHPHTAQVDWGPPARLPQGRVGKAPQVLAPAAVPVHGDGCPGCISACCPGVPAALALALQRCGAARAGRLGSRPLSPCRLPPHTRHHGPLGWDTRQGQRHRGTAALDHQHQPAPRPPPPYVRPPRPAPIHASRVPSPLGLLGWRAPRGEPRPRPHAPGPGDRAQPPHRPPRHANAADDVCRRGAPRLASAPGGGDRPAAAAFPRGVSSQHPGGARGPSAGDAKPPPEAAGLARRLGGPVQAAMIVRERALAAQPHRPSGGRPGAGPGGQPRAQEQERGLAPDARRPPLRPEANSSAVFRPAPVRKACWLTGMCASPSRTSIGAFALSVGPVGRGFA
jgi:hypothetical protein